VFAVDDDVSIDCRLMTDAFRQWRPDRLVGFAPRMLNMIDPDPKSKGYDWFAPCRKMYQKSPWTNLQEYADELVYGTPSPCGRYNTLFLTKGGFAHKYFFRKVRGSA
jgi:hypothetical protein